MANSNLILEYDGSFDPNRNSLERQSSPEVSVSFNPHETYQVHGSTRHLIDEATGPTVSLRHDGGLNPLLAPSPPSRESNARRANSSAARRPAAAGPAPPADRPVYRSLKNRADKRERKWLVGLFNVEVLGLAAGGGVMLAKGVSVAAVLGQIAIPIPFVGAGVGAIIGGALSLYLMHASYSLISAFIGRIAWKLEMRHGVQLPPAPRSLGDLHAPLAPRNDELNNRIPNTIDNNSAHERGRLATDADQNVQTSRLTPPANQGGSLCVVDPFLPRQLVSAARNMGGFERQWNDAETSIRRLLGGIDPLLNDLAAVFRAPTTAGVRQVVEKYQLLATRDPDSLLTVVFCLMTAQRHERWNHGAILAVLKEAAGELTDDGESRGCSVLLQAATCFLQGDLWRDLDALEGHLLLRPNDTAFLTLLARGYDAIVTQHPELVLEITYQWAAERARNRFDLTRLVHALYRFADLPLEAAPQKWSSSRNADRFLRLEGEVNSRSALGSAILQSAKTYLQAQTEASVSMYVDSMCQFDSENRPRIVFEQLERLCRVLRRVTAFCPCMAGDAARQALSQIDPQQLESIVETLERHTGWAFFEGQHSSTRGFTARDAWFSFLSDKYGPACVEFAMAAESVLAERGRYPWRRK